MRSYDAQSLVRLPRVTAKRALVLGDEIRGAYRETPSRRLSPAVIAAADRLFARHQELRREMDRFPGAKVPVDNELRAAANDFDACWAALEKLLAVYARLPVELRHRTLKAKATEMHDALFPDGLRFVLLPYADEWREGQKRIDLIGARGYAAHLEAVGGEIVLASIRSTQTKYGELQARREAAASQAPDVRGKRTGFLDAVRSYVVKIAGLADPDLEGSEALAEALLAPIEACESSARASKPGRASRASRHIGRSSPAER